MEIAECSPSSIERFKAAIPPSELQQRFSILVESMDGLRKVQRDSERQTDQLFQSLIRKAFRGGLSIRDDPSKTLGPQGAAHNEPKTLDDYPGS